MFTYPASSIEYALGNKCWESIKEPYVKRHEMRNLMRMLKKRQQRKTEPLPLIWEWKEKWD